MRLTHILTSQIVLMRMQETSTDKLAFLTVTGINMEIQPTAFENSSIDTGAFGKSYVGYTDGDVSLYPGDRLRDDENNYFTVKGGGATNRQHGRIGYVKVILEKS